METTMPKSLVALINRLPAPKRDAAIKYAKQEAQDFFASTMGYDDDADVVDREAWLFAEQEIRAIYVEQHLEDRPSATFMSARECAIDEQAALYDDSYDDYQGD